MSYYDNEEDYWDGFIFAERFRTAPNTSLYRRVMQDTHWLDAQNQLWKLEDMTSIHRKNLIGWLEGRAEELQRAHFECSGKPRYEDIKKDAVEWLRGQPLLKRLYDLTICPTCNQYR